MMQDEPQDSLDYSPHWTSHPVIVNSSRFDVDIRFCICASTPSESCSDCPVHGIGRRSLFGIDLTEMRHQGAGHREHPSTRDSYARGGVCKEDDLCQVFSTFTEMYESTVISTAVNVEK